MQTVGRIRRLRYVQHKYFPVLPRQTHMYLTLIDPMLPLFARPEPLDGLFFSWLTADRKPATSLPAYQSAAPHHKWPASFPHPVESPAPARSRRVSHFPTAPGQRNRLFIVIMRRGFHPLGKGFGLRATIRRAEQSFSGLMMIVVMRVENMASGLVCNVSLMRRFTAGKRPAKNFTHRCKGVAFMFGKGQQRPQRRLLHYRRIGRRHAVSVRIRQPGGTGTPLCQATRVLPNAMALVA